MVQAQATCFLSEHRGPFGPNRSRGNRGETVPRGKPESGAQRGGFGRRRAHHRFPGPWRLRGWPPAGSAGLPGDRLDSGIPGPTQTHPDPPLQNLHLRKPPGRCVCTVKERCPRTTITLGIFPSFHCPFPWPPPNGHSLLRQRPSQQRIRTRTQSWSSLSMVSSSLQQSSTCLGFPDLDSYLFSGIALNLHLSGVRS